MTLKPMGFQKSETLGTHSPSPTLTPCCLIQPLRWDGGDCCDTSLPLYDCLDPSSPAFGSASARGLAFPAPTNPLYAAGTAGRTATVAGVAQGYNNYYEVRGVVPVC